MYFENIVFLKQFYLFHPLSALIKRYFMHPPTHRDTVCTNFSFESDYFKQYSSADIKLQFAHLYEACYITLLFLFPVPDFFP